MEYNRDLNAPYKSADTGEIEYTVCKDYGHISRYKCLRQVAHNSNDFRSRFVALETVNAYSTDVPVNYYTVRQDEENRLDVIAYTQLGDAAYSWIIAYFNQIEDGFSVYPGQVLRIPKSISSLFADGQLLSTVSPLSLNLGSE